MSEPTLEDALRVVLTHMRGRATEPVPSMSMPLREWEALQEELARLRSRVAELEGQA